MKAVKPSRYLATPRAITDIEDIWLYSAQAWSLDQAERYVDGLAEALEAIASMPQRERLEITPPVRIHPIGRHLVVYRIEDAHVLLIRILGDRQDWASLLATLDA
jgi:toxin ParE1/3/4